MHVFLSAPPVYTHTTTAVQSLKYMCTTRFVAIQDSPTFNIINESNGYKVENKDKGRNSNKMARSPALCTISFFFTVTLIK